jgi:hypothetical protein
MKPDELQKIIEAVKEGTASQVEISVTGKINQLIKSHEEIKAGQEEMKNSFMHHVEEDKITAYKQEVMSQRLNEYIKNDEQEWAEFKGLVQPSLELGTNLRGAGKVLAYLIATIGGIIGIVVAVTSLIKKYL